MLRHLLFIAFLLVAGRVQANCDVLAAQEMRELLGAMGAKVKPLLLDGKHPALQILPGEGHVFNAYARAVKEAYGAELVYSPTFLAARHAEASFMVGSKRLVLPALKRSDVIKAPENVHSLVNNPLRFNPPTTATLAKPETTYAKQREN